MGYYSKYPWAISIHYTYHPPIHEKMVHSTLKLDLPISLVLMP